MEHRALQQPTSFNALTAQRNKQFLRNLGWNWSETRPPGRHADLKGRTLTELLHPDPEKLCSEFRARVEQLRKSHRGPRTTLHEDPR